MAADCTNGYVFNRFPQTIEQARWYYAHYNQPTVHLLGVPREEVLRRIAARNEGRTDDNSDIVAGRMQEHDELTVPLKDFYEREAHFHWVDAAQGIDGTFDYIRNLLIS